jgi:hypothetical protein
MNKFCLFFFFFWFLAHAKLISQETSLLKLIKHVIEFTKKKTNL